MRLPYIATALVIVLVVAIAAVVSIRHAGSQAMTTLPAVALPAFSLQRGDGRAFGERDLHGRVHLVYFGFTTCPDVCPTELGWMARVMRQLGPLAEAVQPVFVTIDPERDTVDRLEAYATAFHPRMLALHGTPAETQAAADAFGVVFRKQTPVTKQAGFYLFDHTMTTFVLDRDGRIAHRLLSHDTTPEAAAALIRPLAAAP